MPRETIDRIESIALKVRHYAERHESMPAAVSCGIADALELIAFECMLASPDASSTWLRLGREN